MPKSDFNKVALLRNIENLLINIVFFFMGTAMGSLHEGELKFTPGWNFSIGWKTFRLFEHFNSSWNGEHFSAGWI